MAKKKKQHEVGWRCGACGLVRAEDGYDPCIGYLPGVRFACCGHGGNSMYPEGYIYFENGTVIRFERLTEIERGV